MMAGEGEDIVDDELSNETRMMVLSFMSLMPSDIGSQAASVSGSLASSGSSSERQRRALMEQISVDGLPPRSSSRHERSGSDNWQRALPSLPESSLVDRVMSHENIQKAFGSWEIDGVVNDSIRDRGVVLPQGEDETDQAHHARLQVDADQNVEEDEPDIITNGIEGTKYTKFSNSQNAAGTSSSSDSSAGTNVTQNTVNRNSLSNIKLPSTERQVSSNSMSSDGTDASDLSSLMMSTRSTGSRSSNYIDIQCNDVDQMVRQGVLPPQVLPLHHQLNQEMEQLRRQSLNKSKSPVRSKMPSATSTNVRPPFLPSASVTTPQTEVAEQLRIIGDTAQLLYGKDVDRAFQSIISVPKDQLTYDLLEPILLELIQHISGTTRRAALVMLLIQRLVMFGGDLHRLVNYTVRFLLSKMASYIITHGGWYSIISLEHEAILEMPVSPSDVHPSLPDSDDVDSLALPPSEPLHPVDTNTTLVAEDEDDTNVIDSMVDSGFQPGTPSGDSYANTASASGFPSAASNEVLSRDMTLESIASLPQDITPVGEQNYPGTSSVPSSNNNTNKVVIKEDSKNHVGKASVAAVQQGRLLRQVSEKLNQDVEKERQLGEILQAIGLATLGTAFVVCSAYFVYRKIVRR